MFTAKVTDNNGVTMVSAPVIVTVDPQPILGSEAMTANGYQFYDQWRGGSRRECGQQRGSDPLESMGNRPVRRQLCGAGYDGGVRLRIGFYRVVEGGVCSAFNTVGFVKMTLPAQSSIGVSNPLDSRLRNMVTLFAGVPTRTIVTSYAPNDEWNVMLAQAINTVSTEGGIMILQ
ncbi:MAG: hypothetical protein U1F98_14205 [Verrucomicrobiota bacterium]